MTISFERRMLRREGLAKLTGREPYVDDLPLGEDFLWGQTVRSPVPRGRVRKVRFGPGVDWSEVVVVDHHDLPGPNVVHLMEEDQPILVAGETRHVHEPVVLLAHRDRNLLRRAAAAVEIDVDPLPAVLDFRRAPRPEEIQWGSDNVVKRITIDKGDVEAALARAPHVVEGIYETGAQEHVYLEPQAMTARLGADGVLVVEGSMQCPYYVLDALVHALGLERERIRVAQTATGGAFGGKEEFPSILALHAALLAMKAERPVKLIYDRGEDLAASTKRHPSWVRHRTGVDADGHLLAQEVEVVLDAGAYVTLSPVVLSRGVLHAAGPYRCANVRVEGRAMLSNHVPYGAFRGFGAPQTHFANERHLDVVAARLGIDPAELRRRNLLGDGDTTATGQVISDGADREKVLDRALELAGWAEKRVAHAAFNASPDISPDASSEPRSHLRRGIGLAVFHHGAGFTGGGEVYLDSVVEAAGLADGRVEILAASVEMGQGTTTIFTQIAAERLGFAHDDVLIARPDTSRVPNSGPTVASRTAMIVGRLVEHAIDDLRARLGDGAATGAALQAAIRAWHAAHPGEELRGRGRYQPPPDIVWDEENYRGDAYGAYGWATYVAEVEVDLRTFTARVLDFVAVQDVGTVLNEVLARGQVQGGVVQAIGWALLEECRLRDGALENAQLTNYVIPTADDVPPIRVAFLETPYEHGAQGAKGLGELPMDGPAPAIANAVAMALGVPVTEIPLVPERLMELAGKLSPARQRPAMRRREGLAKLTGSELYVDDLPLGNDFLWGATVRSKVPRGRIRRVRFGSGIDWSRFVVVDHRDLPGPNFVNTFFNDQPILAADEVRHVHEPVVLLAHHDRNLLRRAVAAVEIEVDPLPPVLDFRRPPAPEQIQRGKDNVLNRICTIKGDVEAALADAPHVIEGIYETGSQEHVYLEPQGMTARLDDDGILVVEGSMQCPYDVLGVLAHGLGLERERIRVAQTATGGAFGGKEEVPSILALHAALLALEAGRCVKLIYERGEDMAATSKRHPAQIRHRTGVDENGRLLAQKIELLLDAGAYVTLSSAVLLRAVLHAAGPYRCPNVRVTGWAVLSNRVPFGAFRGFGAPQVHFANERHLDVVAARLGIDPVTLRRRNLLRDGDTTATRQVIADGADREAVLDRALELAGWSEKRAAHAVSNRAHPHLRRGLGLAVFHHGAGYIGLEEVHLDHVVEVTGQADGRVEILTASVEMGQGTTTVLTQIAAARLGFAWDDVLIARPDTSRVPNSGSTVASRTAMIVGRLVERAIDDLRHRLGAADLHGAALAAAIRAWHREHPGGDLRGRALYEPPPGTAWDWQTLSGDAYGAFGWSAQVVEVEVDLRTYTPRVVDFVAVQDVGTVINAVLARGQVQGGVAQAIGWTLLEECRWRDGALANAQLATYTVPTCGDVPPVRVAFLETPFAHGGLGAKGLGELPIDGPAPAIANALSAALGVSVTRIPITPERLMELVESSTWSAS